MNNFKRIRDIGQQNEISRRTVDRTLRGAQSHLADLCASEAISQAAGRLKGAQKSPICVPRRVPTGASRQAFHANELAIVIDVESLAIPGLQRLLATCPAFNWSLDTPQIHTSANVLVGVALPSFVCTHHFEQEV